MNEWLVLVAPGVVIAYLVYCQWQARKVRQVLRQTVAYREGRLTVARQIRFSGIYPRARMDLGALGTAELCIANRNGRRASGASEGNAGLSIYWTLRCRALAEAPRLRMVSDDAGVLPLWCGVMHLKRESRIDQAALERLLVEAREVGDGDLEEEEEEELEQRSVEDALVPSRGWRLWALTDRQRARAIVKHKDVWVLLERLLVLSRGAFVSVRSRPRRLSIVVEHAAKDSSWFDYVLETMASLAAAWLSAAAAVPARSHLASRPNLSDS